MRYMHILAALAAPMITTPAFADEGDDTETVLQTKELKLRKPKTETPAAAKKLALNALGLGRQNQNRVEALEQALVEVLAHYNADPDPELLKLQKQLQAELARSSDESDLYQLSCGLRNTIGAPIPGVSDAVTPGARCGVAIGHENSSLGYALGGEIGPFAPDGLSGSVTFEIWKPMAKDLKVGMYAGIGIDSHGVLDGTPEATAIETGLQSGIRARVPLVVSTKSETGFVMHAGTTMGMVAKKNQSAQLLNGEVGFGIYHRGLFNSKRDDRDRD